MYIYLNIARSIVSFPTSHAVYSDIHIIDQIVDWDSSSGQIISGFGIHNWNPWGIESGVLQFAGRSLLASFCFYTYQRNYN